MKVNEVLLANASGDTTSQFVELEDPGESFPQSYSIQVYDAAGSPMGAAQAIDPQPGTTRMTLATSQARDDFSLTLQANVIIDLSVELPANGSVCFRGGTMGTAIIHCLSWGVATPPPGITGVTRGPAPGNGQSAQRIGTCAISGTPTPNATNITGTCPTPMPDAGVPDAAPADATPGDGGGGADAGGGGNNSGSDDDGCSAATGASWFALVGLAGVLVIGRATRRRRRA